MDFLSACSVSAQRMGVSYGKYMAMRKDGSIPPGFETERNEKAPKALEVDLQPMFKICSECGNRFDVRSRSNRSETCSDQCGIVRQRRLNRERYREKYLGGFSEVVKCRVCGMEFSRKRANTTICSRKCRDENLRRKVILRKEKKHAQ